MYASRHYLLSYISFGMKYIVPFFVTADRQMSFHSILILSIIRKMIEFMHVSMSQRLHLSLYKLNINFTPNICLSLTPLIVSLVSLNNDYVEHVVVIT